MNEQQPSAIWGLNFLQDDKSEPNVITGSYDLEREVWVMQEQVKSGILPLGKFPEGRLGKSLNQYSTTVHTKYRTEMRTAERNARDLTYDSDPDERPD